jgi:tetratricopeptide (TPR) repeat protein
LSIDHLEAEMLLTRFAVLAATLAAAVMFTVPSFAAGDAVETAAPVALSAKALGCKAGEIAHTEGTAQKCVALAAGTLTDAELYEQGRLLATEGEYEWALQALALIVKQDDPKVLNYIGYSNRKAGRLETGIAAYKKALALDADFVAAREYLGEAYISAGQIDLAKTELAEIKSRCGATCPEFGMLEASLKAAAN